MGNSESQTPLGKVESADDVLQRVKTKMEIILASASNSVPETQRQIEELLSEWENTPLNICVVGKRNAGKSSFINNMSGEMQAQVGIVQTTADAESYTHPQNQKLLFWDLPGSYARFYPTINDYLEKMDLRRFDVILYLYKDGFEQVDKEMYGKICEIGKPLFLVRSKFDNDVQGGVDMETEKKKIDEELEAYGIPLLLNRDKRCYFIANRTQDQPTCYLYDYEMLMEDIKVCLNDSETRKVEQRQALLYTLPLGIVEGADDVKTKMERILTSASNSVPEAMRQIEKLLSEWEKTPLNICAVGKRGVGKSSFINNMSGEMMARVGRIETTADAESYTHPQNQKLLFWDLPGYGARFYPTINDYLEKMDLRRFDVILHLYKDGFEQIDKEMCGKICEIGKPLFLVRSKFDSDVQGGADVEKEKKKIDEELEAYEIPLPSSRDKRCYFIANRTQDQPTCYLYGYEKLMEDIKECLNDSKRQALLYTLQNPNKKLLGMKKKQLEGRIWIAATKACVYGAIPAPGCDVLLNTELVIQEIEFMAKVLGIMGDIESYKHNANNLEFSEVKLQCLQRCSNYFSINSVHGMVKAFGVSMTLLAADELLRFIPGLGSFVCSGISFAVIHRVLTKVLEDFMELANLNMATKSCHSF